MTFDSIVQSSASSEAIPVLETILPEKTLVLGLTLQLIYTGAREANGQLYLPEHELVLVESGPREGLDQASALLQRATRTHRWPIAEECLIAVRRDGLRREWRLTKPTPDSEVERMRGRAGVYLGEDSRLGREYAAKAALGQDPPLVHYDDRKGHPDAIVSRNELVLEHRRRCIVDDVRLHSVREDRLVRLDTGEDLHLAGAPKTHGYRKLFTGDSTVLIGRVEVSKRGRQPHFHLRLDKNGELPLVKYEPKHKDAVMLAHGLDKSVKCEVRPVCWTVAGVVVTSCYWLEAIHV